MIEIRRLAPDDWQLLREIRLTALRDDPSAFSSTYEREAAFAEDQWRARAGGAFFVALDGGDAVGIAAGFQDAEQPPVQRELVSMWVAPSARGKGVAGRLVAAVAQWARGDGAGELALWVVFDNGSARSSYERAGFVRTGEQQPVLPGDPRVEERMVLDL